MEKLHSIFEQLLNEKFNAELINYLGMNEYEFHHVVTKGWIYLAVVSFVALLFLVAPYGRHASKGWGFTMNNRLCWFLMEIPSPLIMLFFFWLRRDEQHANAVLTTFLSLWMVHYANRAIIFPLRIQSNKQTMNATVFLASFFFNLINGYLNGR
jgi:hypothetical protein